MGAHGTVNEKKINKKSVKSEGTGAGENSFKNCRGGGSLYIVALLPFGAPHPGQLQRADRVHMGPSRPAPFPSFQSVFCTWILFKNHQKKKKKKKKKKSSGWTPL